MSVVEGSVMSAGEDIIQSSPQTPRAIRDIDVSMASVETPRASTSRGHVGSTHLSTPASTRPNSAR